MSTAEAQPEGATALVTADELLRDYHEQRCELIEGKVCLMSPTGFGHGAIEVRLAHLLTSFVTQHHLGLIVSGEVGFVLQREPDTVLAPDVAFVTRDSVEAVGVVDKYFPEAPALAVEVVSPSDTAEAVDSKARRWLAAGTAAVWIVYPKGRSVTVYRSLENIRVLTEADELDGGDVLPGFKVTVSDIFAGIN